MTIEAFNWVTSEYDVLATESESFNSDTVTTVNFTKNQNGSFDHIQAGTGAVRSRVGWRQAGFVILFPWSVNVDQVSWSFE